MRFLAILLAVLFTTGVAKPTLDVLVISDFSLAFVPSPLDRSFLSSGPFVCPSSAYPNALSQFQFTSDIIDGVKRDIPMRIQYYVYSGGDGDPIGNVYSSRDNFTETSIPAYTKFCAEGPEENDFERFINLTITPTIKTELLILFTAAPQSQIDKALPILSNNVSKVIVLGLNGASAHDAYPESAVSLRDFSEPERVSCMVNELYETIHGKFQVGDVDAVGICYPATEETTTITEITTTTTTPRPPMTILFVNDFTTDFVGDDDQTVKKITTSNAVYGRCPQNMYPKAGMEYNYTVDIVNGIRRDANVDLMFYEYSGEDEPISPNIYPRDNFGDVANAALRDACFDDHFSSDLNSLFYRLQQIDADVLVLFTAQRNVQSLPNLPNIRRIIAAGLDGADLSNIYPVDSVSIQDFSKPEVVSCMIDKLWDDINARYDNCIKVAPPPPITVLFVNDFTSDFVGDESKIKNVLSSQATYGKCAGGKYPEAGFELDYTVDIVNSISADALYMFSEYDGGYDCDIDGALYLYKEDFAMAASVHFSDACLKDHSSTDFAALTMYLRYVPVDILVLFTAVPLSQPLNLPNFKRVIVVGLNGASVSITDFSRPQVISCMIDRLWSKNTRSKNRDKDELIADNISDASLLSCAN